jgi:hypothetical protein
MDMLSKGQPRQGGRAGSKSESEATDTGDHRRWRVPAAGEPSFEILNYRCSASIPFDMEDGDAVAPPPLVPSPAPVAAAVLTGRRSHLDSASYRTLSRLFSHCFHLYPSRGECSAPPEAELAAANPTGVDSGDSPQKVPKDADFDQRTEDVDNEAAASGTPSRHLACSPARDQPSVANPTGDLGEADAPRVALDGMDVLVVESTRGNPVTVSKELVAEVTLAVEDEDLKSMKACFEGEVHELVEEAVGNDDGQMLLDAVMTDFTGLIDDIGVDSMPAQSYGASGGELQNSQETEEPKQLGGWTEEERPQSNSDCRQVDASGFEEGEIEGELQDLGAQESDSEPANEYADDKEPGGNSVSRGLEASECHSQAHLPPENKGTEDPVLNKEVNVGNGGQLYVTRAQAVSYGEVLDWNEKPLPDDEVLVVSVFLSTNILDENGYITCLLLHCSVDVLF